MDNSAHSGSRKERHRYQKDLQNAARVQKNDPALKNVKPYWCLTIARGHDDSQISWLAVSPYTAGEWWSPQLAEIARTVSG